MGIKENPRKSVLSWGLLPMWNNLTYSRTWDFLNFSVICPNLFQCHHLCLSLSSCHFTKLSSSSLSPQPSNSRITHPTIQLPVAPAENLATCLFLPFLKPRHWLMHSVEQPALYFGPHTASSHGCNLCHPSPNSSKAEATTDRQSLCVCIACDSHRWVSGDIICWLKYV